MALFTTVIGAISLFILLFFPATIEQQALRALEDKADAIGAVTAHAVAVGVQFEDTRSIEAALTAALQGRDVLHVEVRDPAGRVLAFLSASQGEPGDGAASEEGLTRITPVMLAGARVADVVMEVSLDGLDADVARARGLVALVSFAIFLLGLLAAGGIATHVTAPLRAVTHTAESIASGDLRSRAPEQSQDEVGQLARIFNRMVDRLQSAHQQVEATRSQLAQILDNVPADVALFDRDGRYVYVNPAVASDEEVRSWVIGKTPMDFAVRIGGGKETGLATVEAINTSIREARMVTTETHSLWSDGTARDFVRIYCPIVDASGDVTRIVAHGVDITDLRQAEADLRDTQERLLQSQKMESVGRLAGGVAHDFNNLLTTMSGNADLILMDGRLDDHDREMLEEIVAASERASALTQQLLAFSRKQVTQPKVINLNTTLFGIQKMLRRLIGEDVELVTDLDDALDNVLADPGQIEQVIVNLAVNSRDAMPHGGTLAVRTRTLVLDEDYRGAFDERMPAGRYAQITVTDTGTGMDRATLVRIFEPFFTQKEVGKGTGLGLATVYGIVRQANGFVRVYSEPGLGTTFKIFLPSVDSPEDAVEARGRPGTLAPGTETILIAEDQDGVRNMTGKLMERCGYRVLMAEGPLEALEIATNYAGTIHLLLTDVVMPSMSGPALAERLVQTRPDTAVIFMSGYTDDQLQHHGVLQEGVVLVQKPFTGTHMAHTVRNVLDRTAVPT
jgi:PAS domain S-box-containing protein